MDFVKVIEAQTTYGSFSNATLNRMPVSKTVNLKVGSPTMTKITASLISLSQSTVHMSLFLQPVIVKIRNTPDKKHPRSAGAFNLIRGYIRKNMISLCIFVSAFFDDGAEYYATGLFEVKLHSKLSRTWILYRIY